MGHHCCCYWVIRPLEALLSVIELLFESSVMKALTSIIKSRVRPLTI
jgi:hypothetical protein